MHLHGKDVHRVAHRTPGHVVLPSVDIESSQREHRSLAPAATCLGDTGDRMRSLSGRLLLSWGQFIPFARDAETERIRQRSCYSGRVLISLGVSLTVEGERRRPTIPIRPATQAPSLSISTFSPPSSALNNRQTSPRSVR